MKIEPKDYTCSLCGKGGRKLWRPCYEKTPLICAECAEKRRAPGAYEVSSWISKNIDGAKLFKSWKEVRRYPKWTVDDEGMVPINSGDKTDMLVIKLKKGHSIFHPAKRIMIVPALPTDDGRFWAYSMGTAEVIEWWKSLPTR